MTSRAMPGALNYAVLLALGISGCGGTNSAESSALFSLSENPGCWRPPPVIDVPNRPSSGEAMLYAKMRSHEERGAFCVRRMANIADILRDDPGQREWMLPWTTSTGHLKMHVDGGFSLSKPDSGSFVIEISRDIPVGKKMLEPCMNDPDKVVVHGSFSPKATILDHGDFLYAWNEMSTAILQSTPFGYMLYFYRACDSASTTSFGIISDYTKNEIRCWDTNGHFVSCDGINTWPGFVAE